MEMMPHHPTAALGPWGAAPGPLPTFGPQTRRDWRRGLPTLATPLGTLRELTLADAPSLCAHLTTDDVARFISPPPTSVEGFEDFIGWARRRRAQGRYACFAVVPAGQTAAVGLFQVRLDEAAATTAEWGFVLGSAYWGTGLFLAGAQRMLHFIFTQLGIARLEARAVLQNGRGTGALRKVGAVQEAVLRGSFERDGERLDQALWTLARHTWAAGRRAWRPSVH